MQDDSFGHDRSFPVVVSAPVIPIVQALKMSYSVEFNPYQQRATLKLVAMFDGGGRLRGETVAVHKGSVRAAEILNCVDILMIRQNSVASRDSSIVPAVESQVHIWENPAGI